MKLPVSMKRIQIDKANNTAMIVIAITTVVTVFCLMSTKSLVSQASYQRKVINEKRQAVNQLKDNVDAAKKLSSQYEIFRQDDPNIIGGKGGNEPGEGPSDGDNPRIVLDALPSQYDFPALISSIEKIVLNNRLTAQGIGGTDQGDASSSQASSSPQPTEINFSLSVKSSYGGIQNLIRDLERSIRPMNITTMELSGSVSDMQASFQIKTYYQPGKSLVIEEREVK